MRLLDQPWPLKAIWAVLLAEAGYALASGAFSVAFVALATFALTLVPVYLQRFIGARVPAGFIVAVALFLMATLFLGEVRDFYNRFWWWDVVLHGGSAMAFGLIGFLFVFMLFQGDRYAAPAWAVAFMSFSFAITIGALWEIFEFAMDQVFGLNMQKTGLVDTMWDLIVDTLGAGLGATAGFFYLKGRELGGLTAALREFVAANRRLFRRRPGRRRGP